MRKIGGKIVLWVQSGTLKLLVLAGIILLAWGILAPVGTLLWWLSQSSQSLGIKKNLTKHLFESSCNCMQNANDEPLIPFVTTNNK